MNSIDKRDEDAAAFEPSGTEDNKPLEEILKTSGNGAQDEDPDPNSGIVRLSQMVASTSAAEVKRSTRSVPPPAAVSMPAPVSIPPQKAAKTGLVFIIMGGIIVAVLAILLAWMTQQKKKEGSEQLSALMAQLENIEKNRPAQEVDTMAAAAQTAEEQPAPEVKAEEAPVAPAEEVDEEEPVEEEKATKPTSKGKKARRAVKKRNTGKKKAPAKRAKKASAKRATAEPAKEEKKDAKKDSVDLDDYLLGGSGGGDKKAGDKKKSDADEKKGAEKEAAGDALPSKPSKDQVKSVMQKVAAKAAKCSKYSTGTIKVKIVVGNNGRVRSATAQGKEAGTTAGKCVEMLARTARFPKFSDPTFALVYPIVVK